MFTGEPVPRMEAPWLVVLPVFVGLVALAFARGPQHRLAQALGWAPVVAAAMGLAWAPSVGYLHQHVANVLRLGFVEVRLDLVLDRPAAMLLLASAVATAFFGATARRVGLLSLGWTIVMIDDRALATLGWVCLVALVVRSRLGRVASACAAAATALLFWGLGGAYTGEGYAPDMGPRVIAIVSGEAAEVPRSAFDDDDDDEVAMPQYAAGDHGLLSVRALPGSTLYVDGARTPFALRSPFEGQPIPVGYHTFRFHPGQAYDDYVVNQLRIDPGQRVTIVTAGSTTSGVDARDVLGAKLGTAAPFIEGLRARRIFGGSFAFVIAVLLFVAVSSSTRDPLLAIVALGLVGPFVATVGPSPEAAAVVLGCAIVPAWLGARADVWLAIAALFAGAPLPAALALGLSAWLMDSRAAALATVLPRAALVGALVAMSSGWGSVAVAFAIVVTIVGFAAEVRHDRGVPKWYAATFVVGALGALVVLAGWPPIRALALAAGGSLTAFARSPWRAARTRRLRVLGTVLRRASWSVRFAAGGLRRIAPWVVFFATLLLAGDALAAPSLRLSHEGPLVLAPASGTWSSTIVAKNDGDVPLHVLRVSIRDADTDPTLARVHAELSSGLAEVVLAPGASATIDVYWAPAKGETTRSVRGHVMVSSNDPVARMRAVAFRADRATGWGGAFFAHVLAILVGVPAFAAALLALVGLRPRSDASDRAARTVALAAACVTAALGWGVARAFDPTSAALQLVERAVVSRAAGVELFLGVDGASIVSVTQVALLLPVVVLLAPRGRGPLAVSAALGLGSVVLLALLSVDAMVTIVATAAAIALLAVLARSVGSPRAVVTRFVVVSALGLAAFAFAIASLHSSADGGLLVDGSPSTPWSATELARTAFLAKGASVTVAWSLLFVAAAVFGGLLPFQAGLAALVDEDRPVVALAVVAMVLRLGVHFLVRWAIPILPEATRWAAPVVLSLAVASAALGAIGALAARERVLARATFAAAAASFAALVTLTPQGFAAAPIYGPFAAVAAAVVLVGPVAARRAASAVVVTGAGYAAILAVIAVAARSPSAAIVLSLALVAHVAVSARGTDSRRSAAFAVAALVLLCAIGGAAVDTIAVTSRAWGERIARVGGDTLGG